MPAQGKHRDAIVAAAISLFRRHGYSGTGLNDIVALSGAPKGSLYYYFPNGKSSIAEAAVRRAGQNTARTLQELATTRRTAGALVRAYAGLVAGWLSKSKYSDGGPITTTLLELAPGNAGVTQAGREAFAAWRDIIAGPLVEGGVPSSRARALATLAIASIEGSLIQARVERSAEPIITIGRELETMFDAAATEYRKSGRTTRPNTSAR